MNICDCIQVLQSSALVSSFFSSASGSEAQCNIRHFVPHIASHVGGEGAKAEFVLF